MIEQNKKYANDLRQTKQHQQEQNCLKACEFYQSKFPQVSRMSWSTFLNEIEQEPEQEKYYARETNDEEEIGVRAILIDVRTEKEFYTSTIPGSISLKKFKSDILPRFITTPSSCNNMKIVMFCTIGYRSGLEALRLMKKYPSVFSNQNVFHLQGIVPYVLLSSQYYCSMLEDKSRKSKKSKEQSYFCFDADGNITPILVRPSSNSTDAVRCRTRDIHTFSKHWDYTQNKQFKPVYFPFSEMIYHGLAVQMKFFKR